MMQTCFAMELTTNPTDSSSARLFIQHFPHMTFKRAKTVFSNLKKPVQTAVWNKLEHDKENKELSSSLGLALLPPEHQCLILTGTDKPSKELQTKLNQETILALFIRKAEVDQECGYKNYQKIIFNDLDSHDGFYDSPKIKFHITKQELMSMTSNHIDVIKKVQRTILTKKELTLLNELSRDLLNKLKPHYNFDTDGRILFWHGPECTVNNKNREIKFYYREGRLTINNKMIKMAKDGFNCCKKILPYIIPPLLYIHFIIGPTWSSLTLIQDPNLLQQNRDFEVTNKLIDSLQKSNIDGSKHLSKYIIQEVPFKYSYDSLDTISNTLIPISLIPSVTQIYSSLTNRDSLKKSFLTNVPLFLASFSALIISVGGISNYIIELKDIGILSKSIFSAGLPTTLALISGSVALAGIIKGRIDSYKWKKHSIDFTKGESVEQFLNDSSIEINETIHE